MMHSLPESVALRDLGAEGLRAPTLATVVGLGADGPLVLDLVTDGPHAIVRRTTGSGKSELLLSWILGMAATRSPESVSFLFVDFKGGASFGSLSSCRTRSGSSPIWTPSQASRALASLSAELRRRERLLAEHGLRGIDEDDDPPLCPARGRGR